MPSSGSPARLLTPSADSVMTVLFSVSRPKLRGKHRSSAKVRQPEQKKRHMHHSRHCRQQGSHRLAVGGSSWKAEMSTVASCSPNSPAC